MEIALNAIHYLVGKISSLLRTLKTMLIVFELLMAALEHGFLRGKRLVEHSMEPATVKGEDGETTTNSEAKPPLPPSTLIDVIVETVSKCSDETDDGVQLQV